MRTVLLVAKLGIVELSDALFVGAAEEHPAQLGLSGLRSSGEDERSIAEIHEGHVAPIFDAPPVS